MKEGPARRHSVRFFLSACEFGCVAPDRQIDQNRDDMALCCQSRNASNPGRIKVAPL